METEKETLEAVSCSAACSDDGVEKPIKNTSVILDTSILPSHSVI